MLPVPVTSSTHAITSSVGSPHQQQAGLNDPARVPSLAQMPHLQRPGIAVQHASQLRFNLTVEPQSQNMATHFEPQPKHISITKVPKTRQPVSMDDPVRPPQRPGFISSLSLIDPRTMEKARLLARHDIRHQRHASSTSLSFAGSEPQVAGDSVRHPPPVGTKPLAVSIVAEDDAHSRQAPKNERSGKRQQKNKLSSGGPKPTRPQNPDSQQPALAGRGNLPQHREAHPPKPEKKPPGSIGVSDRNLSCSSCQNRISSHHQNLTHCPHCKARLPVAPPQTQPSIPSEPMAEGKEFQSPAEEVVYLRRKLLEAVQDVEATRYGGEKNKGKSSRICNGLGLCIFPVCDGGSGELATMQYTRYVLSMFKF